MILDSEAQQVLQEASTGGLRAHGGLDAYQRRVLGERAHDLLDLSVNVNPYGPAPRVVQAVRSANYSAYPDSTALAVREAYATRWKVSPDSVVLGHGAAELLWTVARALLRPGERVLSVEPTFSELTAAARQHGCTLRRFRTTDQTGFQLDLQSLDAMLARERSQLVYLCTPNNPTGAPLPIADLVTLAQAHPRVWFVVDQAFLSLSDRHHELARVPLGNVICVRSLTKEHSLAGLRLGYLLAAPHVCQQLESARPAWSTSAPAQAAALACLEEEAFVARSRARMLEDRERMAAVLRETGLDPLPSDAPYLLFSTPDSATLHHDLLWSHGILTRDCRSFGLPHHLRVCGLQATHARRFREALQTSLESIGHPILPRSQP